VQSSKHAQLTKSSETVNAYVQTKATLWMEVAQPVPQQPTTIQPPKVAWTAWQIVPHVSNSCPVHYARRNTSTTLHQIVAWWT